MIRLLCATTNTGKLREFRQGAAFRRGPESVSVEPLPGIAEITPPEETGPAFRDNAIVKAVYYSGHADAPVFADDSGLEVEALGGAPGVHSARYAGPGADDSENNRLLLAHMRGVSNRAARFVCVIALARQGRLIETFDGLVEGSLLEQERGSGGFGYDPLFNYPPFQCTLAELEPARKSSVSHRGRAFEKLLDFLEKPDGAARAGLSYW